ncbi:MAG TPA: sigma-70 family RNA polymerase sigma factor [Pyrinomonadaceae bacterium]|nr:sigma-70 family RNA polymerase sigma factor [Pyrinomonadaceae bacterium]
MVTKTDTVDDLTSLTVEELVSLLTHSVQDESSEVFEELIKRFEPLLRLTWKRLISRKPGVPAFEYQDFVHDVLVRLFANLSHLRDPKAFPGYFRQIVLSVAYGYLRKQQTELLPSFGDSTDEADRGERESPSAVLTGIDDRILAGYYIRSYLKHLSPREEEIVTLEFFEDLTTKEIAKKLGLRAGAVRATKARAFSKLRSLIYRDSKLAENRSK